MSNRYDVIIIGSGNAGLGVSAIVSGAGKKIAIIEEREFGGTCPNRGCTPKKILVAAAHSLDEIERASAHGIDVGPAKLNWTKLIQRKKDMISFLPGAMEGVAEKRGDVYRGAAKFVGPNSVEVDGTVLEGDNIVIATGSKTRPLDIPGAEFLITSDEVLSEEEQPEEVVFIGGGVIAMEFSHVYARAGTKVTILEMMPSLLPRVETDAVAVIQAESERIGVSVKTGVNVISVSASGDKFTVKYEIDGQEKAVTADRVINGSGRIANVETLNLEAGDIKHNRIAIETDDYLRSTSNPSVWVCGDSLVTSAQLAPIATYEGQIVGKNIVNGASIKPDYSVLPSGIYTIPALSSVGLTEMQARDKGLDIEVSVNDMKEWFSGKTYAENVAWVKVITDKKADKIIGAHMVGHRGEDLIHIFAMAIRHSIPASQLKDSLYAYPTFSSDIKSMF